MNKKKKCLTHFSSLDVKHCTSQCVDTEEMYVLRINKNVLHKYMSL